MTSAPRWAEWEGLRCEVLARLKRTDALLARAGALKVERMEPPLHACLLEAASAALAKQDAHGARSHAATLLWQTQATADQKKAARLAVIDSYLAERRGEDAFASMLRYQQDYRPLTPDMAERFAQGLLDIGNDANALNWLPPSGEITPARLRVQLRSGLLAPEAVITQARAALAREPQAAYWQVIFEAAERARNSSLQVEALERLLQRAGAHDETAQARAAQRLWQSYLDTAEEIGNREQLLMGEDAAWADFAASRLGPDPFLSRSFYAYLAQRAQVRDIRRDAQLKLQRPQLCERVEQLSKLHPQHADAQQQLADPEGEREQADGGTAHAFGGEPGRERRERFGRRHGPLEQRELDDA